MYVDRSRYFHNGWNGLDFSIVCLGFFDEMNTRFDLIGKADLLSLFRIFRVARLFRALRLLRFYPDLYVMVKGFIGALRSMFWGFCMICLLLIFWSPPQRGIFVFRVVRLAPHIARWVRHLAHVARNEDRGAF